MTISVRNSTLISGTGTSLQTATGVDTLSGSTFVVSTATSTAITSVVDNKGNVYTQKVSQAGGGTNLFVYECQNGVGGKDHRVTVTYSASGSRALSLAEVFDSGGGDIVQQALDAATPFSATTATLAQALELVLLFGATDSGSNPATFAESTGFTILQKEENGVTFWPTFVASKSVSATTALSPSFTSTGATNGLIGILSYKQAFPAITQPPSAAPKQVGDTLYLDVLASTNNGSLTYQWQDNSGGSLADMAGQTGQNLTVTGLTIAMNSRQYRVKVTDSLGTTTSATFVLAVSDRVDANYFLRDVPSDANSSDVRLYDRPDVLVGGDVTRALTGVAGVGAVGTLVPNNSAPLTQVAGTGVAGTLVPNNSVSLTQVAGPGVVGTLVPNNSVPLTQVAGPGVVGTLTPVVGGSDVTAALTGVSGTGVVGTLVPNTSVPLTQVAGPGVVGTLVPNTSVPLTQVDGTGVVGTLTPTTGLTVALTGVSASGDVGTLAPATSVGLTGVVGTGQVGVLAIEAPATPAFLFAAGATQAQRKKQVLANPPEYNATTSEAVKPVAALPDFQLHPDDADALALLVSLVTRGFFNDARR